MTETKTPDELEEKPDKKGDSGLVKMPDKKLDDEEAAKKKAEEEELYAIYGGD